MQEFGGDEEVLGPGRRPVFGAVTVAERRRWLGRTVEDAARDADHAFVDEAFVAGIHALVDFVDDAEGGAG